jgi:hypothetical protein
MSPAPATPTDHDVDTVLEALADQLRRTPTARRAAVILELTASLVDTMIGAATDPDLAAAMVERWAAAGLADRRAAAGQPGAWALH